jgi:hypothetical protein
MEYGAQGLRSEAMQRYTAAGYEVIPELSGKVSGEIAVLRKRLI